MYNSVVYICSVINTRKQYELQSDSNTKAESSGWSICIGLTHDDDDDDVDDGDEQYPLKYRRR